MKELSIEQKAKAYDEAKLRMSAAYNSNRCTIGFMNEIFPELVESGDEKMIKSLSRLVKAFYDVNFPTPEGFSRKDLLDWIEKQGKQKPIDKVEPKFRVGDWVMLDRPVLITKVKDMPYNIHEYWTSEGTWFGSAAKAKLWTIQDAKDGDVLAYSDGSITLFKYMDENIYMAHVLLVDGHIELNNSCAIFNVHPATKEQRDLLFQKMKEAGYEWDADKKKLKKIRQKSVEWSEKDEKNLNDAIDACKARYGNMSYTADWLRTLKDRVFPQPKQEWSEEDRIHYNKCLQYLESISPRKEDIEWFKSLRPQNWTKEDKERYISCLQRLGTGNPEQPETINSKWFKEHVYSKPQWKPSDEQIHYLSWIANVKLSDSVVEQEVSKHLNELLEDLKKLKE